MHFIMILAALGLAWVLRQDFLEPTGTWSERFSRTLSLFLFPPILLMMTALAILCMGTQGQMVGRLTGWFTYSLSLGFLGLAAVLFLKLASQGWKTLQKTRTYSRRNIGDTPARIVSAEELFAAQIGFWQPELVLSEGLLKTLDSEHIEAILAHEKAHSYYRDTFWFFWLGWVRQTTAWLPNTNALWEELLTLRELRADAKAAQQIDSLLLAESLLLVASYPHLPSEISCAAFSSTAPPNRLAQRIDALLTAPELPTPPSWQSWIWLPFASLPLAAVPFHT